MERNIKIEQKGDSITLISPVISMGFNGETGKTQYVKGPGVDKEQEEKEVKLFKEIINLLLIQ